MATRRERPFRTVGMRMQDFGRKLMRQYSISQNAPTGPGSLAPSWQADTQTPLVWPQADRPIEATASAEIPLPAQEPLVETEAARIEPVRAPARPVQRQQAKPTDLRLLAILERHQEQDVERDQIREQKRALLSAPSEVQRGTEDGQPTEAPPPSRPRRGRASFDYVETRTLIPPDEQEKTGQVGKLPPSASPQLTRSSEQAEDDETEESRGGETTFSVPPSVEGVQRTTESSAVAIPSIEAHPSTTVPLSSIHEQSTAAETSVQAGETAPLQDASQPLSAPMPSAVQPTSQSESPNETAPLQNASQPLSPPMPSVAQRISESPALTPFSTPSIESHETITVPTDAESGESQGQAPTLTAQPQLPVKPAEAGEVVTRKPLPSTPTLPSSVSGEKKSQIAQAEPLSPTSAQPPATPLGRQTTQPHDVPETVAPGKVQRSETPAPPLPPPNEAPSFFTPSAERISSPRIDGAAESQELPITPVAAEQPVRVETLQRMTESASPTSPPLQPKAETPSPAGPLVAAPRSVSGDFEAGGSVTENKTTPIMESADPVLRQAEVPPGLTGDVVPPVEAKISALELQQAENFQSQPASASVAAASNRTEQPAQVLSPQPPASAEAKPSPRIATGIQREIDSVGTQAVNDFPRQDETSTETPPVNIETLPELSAPSLPVEAPRVQAYPEEPGKPPPAQADVQRMTGPETAARAESSAGAASPQTPVEKPLPVASTDRVQPPASVRGETQPAPGTPREDFRDISGVADTPSVQVSSESPVVQRRADDMPQTTTPEIPPQPTPTSTNMPDEARLVLGISVNKAPNAPELPVQREADRSAESFERESTIIDESITGFEPATPQSALPAKLAQDNPFAQSVSKPTPSLQGSPEQQTPAPSTVDSLISAPTPTAQRTVSESIESEPLEINGEGEYLENPVSIPEAKGPPAPSVTLPSPVQQRVEKAPDLPLPPVQQTTKGASEVSYKSVGTAPVQRSGEASSIRAIESPLQRIPESGDSQPKTFTSADESNDAHLMPDEPQSDVFEALVRAGMVADASPPERPQPVETKHKAVGSTISRKSEPAVTSIPTADIPPDTQATARQDVFEALAEAGMIPSGHIARKAQSPAQDAELDLLNLLGQRTSPPSAVTPPPSAVQRPAESTVVMRVLENEPAAESSKTNPQKADVDVEQLAQDVYNALRNRLRIEHERRG